VELSYVTFEMSGAWKENLNYVDFISQLCSVILYL
jgi:hypothetical protein